jgi:predicted permease
MDWNARLRAALGGTDDDVIEELAQHARALFERARADGASAADADRLVTAQIERWRDEAPQLRRRPRRAPVPAPPPVPAAPLAGLAQDVRYAGRLIARQPGFALLVVLTMALGVGATTTLFNVTYGVLMKPLPWRAADRLVVLKESRGGRAPRFGSMSNAAYLAWREQAATLDALAAWTPQTVTMVGAGDPERIRVTASTASLFRALDVQPVIGSLFADADEQTPVVVLSESLWRQRFGADPAALGRVVNLDDVPRTIVGVVADAVMYPDRQARAWVPFRVAPPAGNRLMMFEAVAKLAPAATVEQAAAEAMARGRSVVDTGLTTIAIFGGDGAVEVEVRPLRDALTAGVRRPLVILLAAVGLLLAISTANIAGLQLARATTRRRELAIRAALGASGSRAIRQLLVESLLLGTTGGVLGLGLAWLLLRGAAAILPTDFPRAHDLAMDATVAAFAVFASLAASVVFGVLPALHLRRINLAATLTEDGTAPAGVSGRSQVARRRLLIIGSQVAVTCVLLASASLAARSFVALVAADRGFNPAAVLTAPIQIAGPGYSPERRVAVLRDIIDRLRTMPGVQHAGFSSEAPWMPGGSTSSLTLPSRTLAGSTVPVQASPRIVSPGYFGALGLRMVAGRPLEESDTPASQPVVVVNETFARRYLGDAPLDATIPMGVLGPSQTGMAAIVGVVEDVRYVRATVETLPEMYFSAGQVIVGMRSTTATLLVRGTDDPAVLAAPVRTAVRQADASLVPGAIMTIEDRLLSSSLARPRLYALLLASFAVAALLVTGVGLFGVLSFIVAQRTRELGIRAALGARRVDLVTLVVRQGLGIVVAGTAVGLLVSLWSGRFMTALLYGITARDPLTYLIVPLVLLAVAAAACVVPALRAARLDPLRALRS